MSSSSEHTSTAVGSSTVYSDAPEVVYHGHVPNPDFNGQKIFVAEPDRENYPQVVPNSDPAQAPQLAVGGAPKQDFAGPPGYGEVTAGKGYTALEAGPIDDGGHSSKTAATVPWWKRKRWLAVIALATLIIIGLGVGLGVGLTAGKDGSEDSEDDGQSSKEPNNQGLPHGGSSNSDTMSCDGSQCLGVLSFSVSDGELNIFGRSEDGDIVVRTNKGGKWGDSWTNMDANSGDSSIATQPTSIAWWTDGDAKKKPRTDVFAVNTVGTVMTSYKDGADGDWSSWESLGAHVDGQVKVCRPDFDQIDIWSLNEDDKITHNGWEPSSSGHTFVKRNEKRQSSEGKWRTTGSSASWETLAGVSGTSASNPGVVCRNDTFNRDLVWYDRSSGNLMHSHYDDKWSEPNNRKGNFVGDPLLFSNTDINKRFDFFGLQTDGKMYTMTWLTEDNTSDGGKYGDISSIGDSKVVSSPSVYSTGDGKRDVVALGENGNLYHQHNDGAKWLDDWEDLGVKARSAPMTVRWAGDLMIFSVKEDGNMQLTTVPGKYLDSDSDSSKWESMVSTRDMSSPSGGLNLAYYMQTSSA